MAYLSSSNVRMFPSAFRNENDLEASLNTEFNLTTLITRLTDRDSFVIHYSDYEMLCSIHGYWFKLTLDNSFATGDWYAVIKVSSVNYGSGASIVTTKKLYNIKDNSNTLLDSDSDFEGLLLVDDESDIPAEDDYYYLHILHNNVVPEDSWIRIGSHGVANVSYTNNLPSTEGKLPINRDFEVDVKGVSTSGITLKDGSTVIEKTTSSEKEVNVPTTITRDVIIKNGANNRVVVDTDGTIVINDISGNAMLSVATDGVVTISNDFAVKYGTYDRFSIDTDGTIVFKSTTGTNRLEISADGLSIKKYFWNICVFKIDANGNTGNYDFAVPTISGLTIRGAVFEHSNSRYEFDVALSDGVRVFYVSSDGVNWTKGQEYQKTNLSYSDGSLNISYNN